MLHFENSIILQVNVPVLSLNTCSITPNSSFKSEERTTQGISTSLPSESRVSWYMLREGGREGWEGGKNVSASSKGRYPLLYAPSPPSLPFFLLTSSPMTSTFLGGT